MMAEKDWYAIGASFKGKRMGVKRPNATMSPLDVMVMKHAFSQPGVATAAINYYRSNMFRTRKSPSLERALTQKLPMPVLVIWGAGDEALGLELLDGLDRYCHDVTVKILPECSHWVQVDAHQEVNDLLLDFCDKHCGESEGKEAAAPPASAASVSRL